MTIKRNGFREGGPSAEMIERGARDFDNVKGYGLCNTCINFSLIESNGTPVYTNCMINYDLFRPGKIFPITKCSNYWSVDWLGYKQLNDMAWSLELRKGRVGFVKPKPKKELEHEKD